MSSETSIELTITLQTTCGKTTYHRKDCDVTGVLSIAISTLIGNAVDAIVNDVPGGLDGTRLIEGILECRSDMLFSESEYDALTKVNHALLAAERKREIERKANHEQ